MTSRKPNGKAERILHRATLRSGGSYVLVYLSFEFVHFLLLFTIPQNYNTKRFHSFILNVVNQRNEVEITFQKKKQSPH